VRNQPVGVGKRNVEKYLVREESLDWAGKLSRRILERQPASSPYLGQKKINAFNFPFTGNPGAGCFFQCVYCYLRQPFFQRHVTADHGKEMNFVPNMVKATEQFLRAKQNLPQYMKRVQMGVSTEMFMAPMLPYTKPDEVLKVFQNMGKDWMVHLVTKSPAILDFADQLAEMKAQVQVEVSLVTIDEDSSRIFEQGTPSVAQRLRIIETLAKRGIFVRLMLMPVMREYELQVVGKSREIVFQNAKSGARRPGIKRIGQVDGNFGAGEIPIELFDGKKWVAADPGETWKPVVVKDWSNAAHAQANWRNYGASAYKQKDLNYFYVDELIAANKADRAPREERGRSEDPTSELLIQSGETVRADDGSDRTVEVQGWHIPKKEWPKDASGKPVNPPVIKRRVMDFGYEKHSNINWIDCV
jgi:DNA repair photolyase